VRSTVEDLPEISDFTQYVAQLATQELDNSRQAKPEERDGLAADREREHPFETVSNTYTVQALIGEGGAGVVYRVEDVDGQELALKSLRPESRGARRLRRFRNEIGVCRALDHPHIVDVRDVGFVLGADGTKTPFYVMPLYVETLRVLMTRGVEPETALELFEQLLHGVEAMHLRGIWHRDLKPENILYDPAENRVAVADFGIAHVAEALRATEVVTLERERLANYLYAAPEQRRKGAKVDERCDIYALGLILAELITGDVPQGTDYKKVSEAAPSFAFLDPVVDRMLRQDPASRHPTIADVKLEIAARSSKSAALQVLDEASGQVLHSGEAPQVEVPRLVSTDYDNGALIFDLTCTPDEGIVDELRKPSFTYNAVTGSEPHQFRFDGTRAAVPLMQAGSAKRVREHFQEYLLAAVESVEQRRKTERDLLANQRLQQQREAVRRADDRIRVLDDLQSTE